MDPRFGELRGRLHARPGRPLNLPGLVLRESAVLIPLFLRDGVPHAIFTKRPTTLRTHAGQISFPGGTRDAADPTPLHTALREAEEELGIPPSAVETLGMLDEIPTVTEFRITPFVGVIPAELPLRPNAEEIAAVLQVPLPVLLEETAMRTEQWEVRGVLRDVYFFEYEGHVIWGATARILKDLLDLVADLPSWSTTTP